VRPCGSLPLTSASEIPQLCASMPSSSLPSSSSRIRWGGGLNLHGATTRSEYSQVLWGPRTADTALWTRHTHHVPVAPLSDGSPSRPAKRTLLSTFSLLGVAAEELLNLHTVSLNLIGPGVSGRRQMLAAFDMPYSFFLPVGYRLLLRVDFQLLRAETHTNLSSYFPLCANLIHTALSCHSYISLHTSFGFKMRHSNNRGGLISGALRSMDASSQSLKALPTSTGN
jgi:hypothetical protein